MGYPELLSGREIVCVSVRRGRICTVAVGGFGAGGGRGAGGEVRGGRRVGCVMVMAAWVVVDGAAVAVAVVRTVSPGRPSSCG